MTRTLPISRCKYKLKTVAMRNIIRTSHEQRRRCSLAVSPDYLSPGEPSHQRRGSLTGLLPTGYDATARRNSGHALEGFSFDQRRGSDCGASLADLRRPVSWQPYTRPKSCDDSNKQSEEPSVRDIRNRDIMGIVALVLSCCLVIVILSYYFKR